jgi:hypothetical protein
MKKLFLNKIYFKALLILSLILYINQQLILSSTNLNKIYAENNFNKNKIIDSTLIMFISRDINYDSIALNLLKSEGYKVVTTYPVPLNQTMIDSLNKADLIIIGRSSTSSDLQSSKKGWNSLTVPLMLMSQHSSSKDKLGWFNSNDVPHLQTPGIIKGYKSQNDSVFYGVNFISGDTMQWSVKPEDIIIVNSVTNAKVIVWLDSTIKSPLLARFETGTVFYPGTCDKPYAPRTYFATGLNTGGVEHPYPLTPEAKKVWLAEVKRLLNLKYTPYSPSHENNLSMLNINTGTLNPAFSQNITSYNVELPAGTTSVNITATPVDACATITGTGNINITSGTTTNITVKAEDGLSGKTYSVSFTVMPSVIKKK